MARPAGTGGGMSRLDVAKMIVEDLSRQLKKRHAEHVRLLMANPVLQRSMVNLGQMGNMDAFLLLSTSRQYPDTAACGAGGRLLVGFSSEEEKDGESFQHELKGLKAAQWDSSNQTTFPEDAGGAVGLNAALSAGLQLLSRYRLQNRWTENFGMGRLPNAAISSPNNANNAALQPACLVLVTDGACLRQAPKLGGGSLQLQFGSQPLREFYTEPFRWDQRIFCLGVGGREGVTVDKYLHPQLRALCEVTGGSHWMARPNILSNITVQLLQKIRPPLPRELPFVDPLFQRLQQQQNQAPRLTVSTTLGSSFINAGPVCCFQAIESEDQRPVQHRAMLLYSGSNATMQPGDSAPFVSPPLWFIPEAFFPSKKLDTLPPRMAQPLLHFSKYPSNLGSKSFEPLHVIKMLFRLDQLIATNRKMIGHAQPRLLHRDVYICEWLAPEGERQPKVNVSSRQEYFPVLCRGAGRPSLADDASEAFLNIGILHVPLQQQQSQRATLTLLPPEPHLLLPLLIRAAEFEFRALKKAEITLTKQGNTNPVLLPKQIAAKAMISVDEQWRSEFRAYLFRLPPYYQFALKRALRPVLPSVTHGLLPNEVDMVPCFSQLCQQKIRNGEQISRDMIERLERQETSLKNHPGQKELTLRYGQFDPRSSVDSYLAALRGMPPPWKVHGTRASDDRKSDGKSDISSIKSDPVIAEAPEEEKSALDILGDLPPSCLMAYYESRRRWIFGGPSLSTRGLIAEGVPNSGSNSQQCGKDASDTEECLLTVGGVGVATLNKTTTHKMGDYRERLLFSRSPVVGYGSNDSAGVAATTAVDGSPRMSVDDDAMPVTFFDPKTGEFADSAQARVRSRLMVNFGNPYKEKRGDSLIPEKFLAQAPSMQQGGFSSAVGDPLTPPGSPPHDSFDSVEEGEAMFVRTSPSRSSPKREEPDEPVRLPPAKKARNNSKPPPPKPSSNPPAPPPPKTGTIPPPPKPSVGTPGTPKPPNSAAAPPKPATSGAAPPKPATSGAGPTPPKPASASAPPPPKLAASAPPPPNKPGASKPPPPKVPKKGPPPPRRPPPPKPPGGKMVHRHSIKGAPPPKPPPGPGQAPIKPPVPRPAESTGTPTASPVVQKSVLTAPPDLLSPALPKRPTLGQQDSPAAAPTAQMKTAATQPDLQSQDKKPNVNLAPGWMCVWSKSQKRWYFFDTKSNKSVWEWPPPS